MKMKDGLLVLGRVEMSKDEKFFFFYLPKDHIYRPKEIKNLKTH